MDFFASLANDGSRPSIRLLWRSLNLYLFFHPPRCPGAPPLDRGAGPNSGPDWRESVGWKILLPLSGEGFRGRARSGRKGRDSGPCISSRWGLWTFEPLAPPVDEGRGEGEEAPVPRLDLSADDTLFFFIALTGKLAASPYFFVPA